MAELQAYLGTLLETCDAKELQAYLGTPLETNKQTNRCFLLPVIRAVHSGGGMAVKGDSVSIYVCLIQSVLVLGVLVGTVVVRNRYKQQTKSISQSCTHTQSAVQIHFLIEISLN